MSQPGACSHPQSGMNATIRAGSGFLHEGPNGERGPRAHIEVAAVNACGHGCAETQIVLDAYEWADLIAQMTNEVFKIGGQFRDAYEARMRRQRHMFN